MYQDSIECVMPQNKETKSKHSNVPKSGQSIFVVKIKSSDRASQITVRPFILLTLRASHVTSQLVVFKLDLEGIIDKAKSTVDKWKAQNSK